MPGFTQNEFATVVGVLAAAVADNGTFTVAYPTGTSQLSFNTGLSLRSGSYIIMNNDIKWNEADPGIGIAYGASEITITNLTNASLAAGTAFTLNLDKEDGNDVVYIDFPINLAAVSAADVVTEFRPGINGVIEHASFVVTQPVTTAAKLATLNLEIGTTNVTGGTIALTSANCTPLGAIVEAAAITAAATLTKESKLSVEAASVTAFVEGEGILKIRVRKT